MKKLTLGIVCVLLIQGLSVALGGSFFDHFDRYGQYGAIVAKPHSPTTGVPDVANGTNGWRAIWWKATGGTDEPWTLQADSQLGLQDNNICRYAAFNTNLAMTTNTLVRVTPVQEGAHSIARGLVLNLTAWTNNESYYFVGIQEGVVGSETNVHVGVFKAAGVAPGTALSGMTTLLNWTNTGVAWTTGANGTEIGNLRVDCTGAGKFTIAFGATTFGSWTTTVTDVSGVLTGGYAGVMLDTAWSATRFDHFAMECRETVITGNGATPWLESDLGLVLWDPGYSGTPDPSPLFQNITIPNDLPTGYKYEARSLAFNCYRETAVSNMEAWIISGTTPGGGAAYPNQTAQALGHATFANLNQLYCGSPVTSSRDMIYANFDQPFRIPPGNYYIELHLDRYGDSNRRLIRLSYSDPLNSYAGGDAAWLSGGGAMYIVTGADMVFSLNGRVIPPSGSVIAIH